MERRVWLELDGKVSFFFFVLEESDLRVDRARWVETQTFLLVLTLPRCLDVAVESGGGRV